MVKKKRKKQGAKTILEVKKFNNGKESKIVKLI